MSAFAELANERRWIAWRNEDRAGKTAKVPYCSLGRKAQANNPETWMLRQDAEAVAAVVVNGNGGGVGVQLGDLGCDSHLVGVDLDSCVDADRCLAPWAEKILAELPTYTEFSPSGTGVKAFFYCMSEDIRPFLGLLGVADPNQWGIKRGVGPNSGNHGPGVEIYCARRYFAVTERPLPGTPERIATLNWTALERLATVIPQPNGTTQQPHNGGGHGGGRDNSRSAKAFREGAKLRRDGKTYAEMCAALRMHSDPDIRDWVREKGDSYGGRELRRIWDRAATDYPNGTIPTPAGTVAGGVQLDDFWAYMPSHSYIFAPTGEMWPAASVNSRIQPVPAGAEATKASYWLDKNKSVEQMTWAPGLPMIIDDRLISDGGWIERDGVRCFNLYRPPTIKPGDPAKAGPWIAHIRKVFPAGADHIIAWLAHRVQRPGEKVNHALLLGGAQGIGKDTILEPVKHAVGPWNFSEPSPQQVMGRFNGFVKAVIMRINEARDLGEFDRFKFYDHLKIYTAAPPDVLRVDEKHLREHAVFNVCGVIITTNHKTDGIYLPADDRRHYVAWSDLTKDDFSDDYWRELYSWYDGGGAEHVAAFLRHYDLSGFNPKAPPPKTAAFWEIVEASHTSEDSELADALDALANPAVVRLQQLMELRPNTPFSEWLADRKNSRLIPHRMEKCGYVRVRNDAAADGQWKVNGRRQAIYGRVRLPAAARYEAARNMAGGR